MFLELILLLGAFFPVVFSHANAPYHYDPSNKGKMEFTVHNSNLPISGSFDFYSPSTAGDFVYLMSVDNKIAAQRIVICIFYGLNDGQWHTLNWTLNGHMHQCQTDRHNDYTKTWFSDVEEFVVRFDIEEVHRRPDCIKNMRIRGQNVSGCQPNSESVGNFTSTAAVCGCPNVQERIEEELQRKEPEEPPTCTCIRR